MDIRSRLGRSKRRMMSEMNVVPYIDVMLVLVVILMVSAPFVNPSIVNLPSVHKASNAPQETVEVVVHSDGKLSIKAKNGLHPVTMDALVNNVKATLAGLDTPVVIAADKDVNYGQVIDVMKALQGANVGRVGLSLQIENSRK